MIPSGSPIANSFARQRQQRSSSPQTATSTPLSQHTNLTPGYGSSSFEDARPVESQVTPVKPATRTVQHVYSLRDRRKSVTWMMQEVSDTNTEVRIATKIIGKFPSLFRGNFKANCQKAARWWKGRFEIMDKRHGEVHSVSTRRVRLQTQPISSSAHRQFFSSKLVVEEDAIRKSGW